MGVKATVQKISDAISGGNKPDVFTVAADADVMAAKAAEAEAVKRAHELENGLAQLVSDRTAADNEYTRLAGLPDETAVREGRRKFIAADETVRARQDHIRRAQAAAVEARKKREQAEVAAEVRCAEALREAVAANVRKTRALVEGSEGMRALAEERERLGRAADALSSWGSPAAQRIGTYAGMGTSGREILSGRGVAGGIGPHTVNAAFLHDPYYGPGCAYAAWLESAKGAGIVIE